MPNYPAHDPHPFPYHCWPDIGDVVVVNDPSGLIFPDHIDRFNTIQFGHLVLSCIEEIIKIFRIVQMLKRIAILETDNRPAVGLFGILSIGMVFEHAGEGIDGTSSTS